MGSAEVKIAVVTGAARRIGRAIAVHLHDKGFDIALHYHTSFESAQALGEELSAQRADSCQLFQADLQDREQVSMLSHELQARYSSIALLVNNASGFSPTPIETSTPQELDTMLSTNLLGPYFLIQGLLPMLRSGGANGASIVNILDVHVDRPLRHYNAYGAAKAGMASLTRSLALELGPDVRVNGVAPGAILWPEGDDSYDEAMREKTLQQTPLKRLGEPMDIARTVSFLACDAPFITGQVIVVDGGRCLV